MVRIPSIPGAALATLVVLVPVLAEPVVFKDVKIRFNRSESDRRLIDKSVELVFDDAERHLVVKSPDKPVTIPYDDVQKVVFDVTTHMRGGAFGQVLGGVTGAVIQAKHVNDYWFYIG